MGTYEPSSTMDQKINAWAYTKLLSLGYTLKSNVPENVQNTPWSDVARFETTDGDIYLKHTPSSLALEAPIIHILHDQFQANVPEIIAHNDHLRCFLMKDAGMPLRQILKQRFNAALYCKAIHQFTSMQLTTADHSDVFLDVGVPDWRLEKIPDLYMQLLLQRESLITDGLSDKEINECETRLPQLVVLCRQLAKYGIKQSIVQPDFHDNNILIAKSSQHITFIDLGEIAISHPFFSLLNCLNQAKKHHALADEDATHLQLMDAWLDHFATFGSKKNLITAMEIATQLAYIYQALAYHRLMLACDKQTLQAFYGHGRLSRPLKTFLTVCKQIDKQSK